jgi:predicted PurR-regulated permease PerM
MNKTIIKLVVFLLLLAGLCYTFIVPYTKSQIFTSVDNYLNLLQDSKGESLALITTPDQRDRDLTFIDNAQKKFGGIDKFANRNVTIITNTLSTATVRVTTVVQVTINGQRQTQNWQYDIQLRKQINPRGEKVWTIINRK